MTTYDDWKTRDPLSEMTLQDDRENDPARQDQDDEDRDQDERAQDQDYAREERIRKATEEFTKAARAYASQRLFVRSGSASVHDRNELVRYLDDALDAYLRLVEEERTP